MRKRRIKVNKYETKQGDLGSMDESTISFNVKLSIVYCANNWHAEKTDILHFVYVTVSGQRPLNW